MNYQSIRLTSLFLLSFLTVQVAQAQKQIEVGGMGISWNFEGDQLKMELTAPNDGWVALGFNQKNDIKDTHLLMFTYENGNSLMNDLYVKAAGNPVAVEEMFKDKANVTYECAEKGRTTKVSFTIDTASYPAYSTSIKEGTKLWLICAFSEDDDFAHHSMMRKHVEVTL
ncbi:MAG: DOMON domain-containing protein [Bacteroidota bacterium]